MNISRPAPSPILNLLSHLPESWNVEQLETVAEFGGVRIERILSKGHASPLGFWYDQDEDEWVLVVQGHARLMFDGRREPVELRTGDSLLIPAHCRHRVEWTSPDDPTIWLAVFHRNGEGLRVGVS